MNQFHSRPKIARSEFAPAAPDPFFQHEHVEKVCACEMCLSPRQEAVTSADESWHFYGRLFSPRPSSHCSIGSLTGRRFAVNMPEFPFYADGGGLGPLSSHGRQRKKAQTLQDGLASRFPQLTPRNRRSLQTPTPPQPNPVHFRSQVPPALTETDGLLFENVTDGFAARAARKTRSAVDR